CLLWADPPEPAEVMAVYPDCSFPPAAHVEESVTRAPHFERAAVEAGARERRFQCREPYAAERIERKREDGPAGELAPVQRHTSRDPLSLSAQRLREVDPPHVLDEDVERGAGGGNAQAESI